MIKPRYLLVLLLYSIILPSSIFAQVYTFDYLTYSDQGIDSIHHSEKAKVTGYIFKGLNEFDANGEANAEDISYSEWYLYFSYRFYSRENLSINAAFQGSVLMAIDAFGSTWGTPWLWANFKLPLDFPLWFRVGYKFGKIGSAIRRIEDDNLDIGLSFSNTLGFLKLDYSASYRFRKRMNKSDSIGDLANRYNQGYNQAGNEIHFKFEPSMNTSQNTRISFFIIGYHGENKKYNKQVLPDSKSYKAALGANFSYRRKSGRLFILGLLADFYGRYDKKGFALVFNIAK